MRYLALATDYDGTLAHHGTVDGPTLAALEQLRATGRKLLLVTGRELPELLTIFPQIHFFEWVVAENGALLYRPAERVEKLLAAAPPPEFVEALRRRGVGPISVGKAIVATWHPHETTVLEVIRDLGLELQVIFNKEAVMVLPSGVNKATGLAAALRELGLSPHNVVGIGDAENDHAFLRLCECSVAVDNAVPMLKEAADLVTRGARGAGVVELIERLVADDLQHLETKLTRHRLLLGHFDDGTEARLRPHGLNLLIAGPSGSGKSTAASAFLERLAEHHYQFCIIDPEGDYERYEGAVGLGTGQRGPSVEEVLQLLEKAETNVVVNLIGLRLADRPPFFVKLLAHLQEMRARTGRPHWLIVDEAHHLMPASWEPASSMLPQDIDRVLLITVHPDQVAPAILRAVDTLIAVGQEPAATLGAFCRALGERTPGPDPRAEEAKVVLWSRQAGDPPRHVRLVPGRAERHRHTRKYAEGELPPDRSFYFRGPEGKLNLRAQNLILFLQLADGVDDETWLHHLRQGDYSRWFRDRIKDAELAAAAAEIEADRSLPAAESRQRIREAVEKLYTLPASAPLPMPGTDAAPRHG